MLPMSGGGGGGGWGSVSDDAPPKQRKKKVPELPPGTPEPIEAAATLLDMFYSFSSATKSKYYVVAEIFNKAVDPSYVVNANGYVTGKNYERNITTLADMLREMPPSMVPTYTMLVKQKITRIGDVDPAVYNELCKEVLPGTTGVVFQNAYKDIINFISSGIEVIGYGIRWSGG